MPKVNEGNASAGPNEDSLSLKDLPVEIHEQIAKYLPAGDLLRMTQTSKLMFFYYNNLLQKRLLSHIVKGEEAQALEIIEGRPGLLLMRSDATDYSGRCYKGFTAFQAALLCHDVTLWKKIMPYFDKLDNGKEEKVKQFKELFPEGIPEQKPYDFSSLNAVFVRSSDDDIKAAINKEDNTTEIYQALKDFRKNFRDLAIKELFFNPSHLLKASTFFLELQDERRLLYTHRVMGYIQRFLPACYAQAFCQGIYSIVNNRKPLERSLVIKHLDPFKFDESPPKENEKTVYFYPLGGPADDFAIYGTYPGEFHATSANDTITVIFSCVAGAVSGARDEYSALNTDCQVAVNPAP